MDKVDKDFLFFLLLKAKVSGFMFSRDEFYEKFEVYDGHGDIYFRSTTEDFPITATKLWKDFIKLLKEQEITEKNFMEKEDDKKLEEEYKEFWKEFKVKYYKMLNELIEILKKEF